MSIVLTFDQDLKGTTVPNAHFTVSVDDEAGSLSGTNAAVSGTTVTLSLTDTLIGANKVTVRYTDPTDGRRRLGDPGPARQRRRVVHRRHGDQHRRGRHPGRADRPHGDHDPHPRRDARLDGAERHREHRNFGLPNRGLDRQRGELGRPRRPIPGRPTRAYTHEGLTPNTRYDYRVSAINADGAGTASTSINTTTAAEITISSIAITSDPDPTDQLPFRGRRLLPRNLWARVNDQNILEVTVTFSAAVDVQTPTTSKAVALEIAGQTKLAAYSSGSGTTALLYKYTVEEGLEDRDGVSFKANALRGGGIVTKDKGAGFEADLSHAVIADDNAHKVDSIRPAVVYAEESANQLTFSVGFRETVTIAAISLWATTMGERVGPYPVAAANQRISGNTVEFDNPYPLFPAGTPFDANMTIQDVAGNLTNPSISGQTFSTASTPPTAPQNLTALPGNGRVTLTWDAPDSDGGRAIDSYESRHSSDGGDNWSDWTEIPDSGPGGMNRSRYRVMGLTNGTTYTLELRAVTTAAGDGAAAQTTGMPREPGAIGVAIAIDPTSPIAEDVGTVTVTVTAANTAAEVPEAGVTVTVSTANGTAMAGEDFESLSETVTFALADFALVAAGTHWEASEDLTLTITNDDVDEEDETFVIKLAASGDSESEVSLGAGITVTITDDDEVPGAPTLTAEAGDAEVTLEWTAPTNPGTSTIDGYDYRVGDAAMTWDPDWTAVPGGANATSYTVTMYAGSTLANGTAYTFEVRARSAAGEGPEAQATTTPGEVCGRTRAIANAIVSAASVSACGDVTATDLAGITELVKTGGEIPALKSGDFAGLSAMTKLNLSDNIIGTLPADIFAGLSQLEELDLDENLFVNGRTLPAGVFSGLTCTESVKAWRTCELRRDCRRTCSQASRHSNSSICSTTTSANCHRACLEGCRRWKRWTLD